MSLPQILKYILIIIEVLFIFNLIIVVHELGHFLAARWRGLVVEEFGVWFGKPLWRRKFGGVYYSLGTIPAGGFVKLPQLAPMKSIEGAPETEQKDLPPIKPVDKIIVAFAGPLFSFLLALALGCVVWAVGKPEGQQDTTVEVGKVMPKSKAEEAGLRMGDKILAIDGKPVSRWRAPTESVIWGIVSSEGEKIHFLVERDGQQKDLYSGYKVESQDAWKRKATRQVGILPRTIPKIIQVRPDSPAAKAGLQKGDVVLVANEIKIFTLDQIDDIMKAKPTEPLALQVQRGEQTVPITVSLEGVKNDDSRLWALGAEWGSITLVHPTPWHQVSDSVRAIGNMLRSVTSPKSDIKVQHFSGPVGIMNVYRLMLLDDQGWRLAIFFSVFFNVNLALINMLPLPVLDGGHITLGLIELLRGRPIRDIRILEYLETGCTLAILGFLIYVTFYDVGDLFNRGGAKKEAAPPAATEATPAPK